MNMELTEAQRQTIAEGGMTPPRIVDPTTNITYVLLRADVFERLQGVLGGDPDPRGAYPAIDRAFAAGWDDPSMDDYDHYEERKQ